MASRRCLGVLVESLRAVAPLQVLAVQRDLPGALARRLRSEDPFELLRQRLVLDQHALLAVEPGGARIQVVAADEQSPSVDGECLRVQGRAGRSEQAGV